MIQHKLGLNLDEPISLIVVEDFTTNRVIKHESNIMKDKNTFDVDGMMQFFERYFKGELKPYIRTQDLPEEEFEEGVRVVVGKTFEEIVLDETKDVLIEFYAPWCGHCKALAPIYSELASKLSSVKDLVIAKIDATENDTPDNFEFKGFPTILFSPRGDKNADPIRYEG